MSRVISNQKSTVFKLPTFQEYKNDIQSFNTEEYLRKKMETNNIELLSSFLDIYKRIEDEDSKKPIFSQTAKFKKFPNHLKYYKYIKFSREEEARKGWNVKKPVSEKEKIELFIRSQLNKMSEDNFSHVMNEFINTMEEYDHPELFEILSEEIFIKCIQDSKYRQYYLQLCNEIWMNKRIHAQRFEIIDLESDFYVKFKYTENDYGLDTVNEDKIIGPFTNENISFQEAYKLMNFKRYFLNFLENKFLEKDITFQQRELGDQQFFEKKRQILGLVDILCIMFQEKYIHMDILHIMILNFLHVSNNVFDPIEEIEMESVHYIIQYLYERIHIQKQKYPIFDNYIEIVNGIVLAGNQNMTKRMEFFLGEIKNMIENPLIQGQNSNRVVIKTISEKEIISLLKKSMKEENLETFMDYVQKYLNETNNEKIVENIFMYILDQKDIKEHMIEYFEKMCDVDIQRNVMMKVCENIQDMSMDISNLHKKILKTFDLVTKIDIIEMKELVMADMERLVREDVREDWEKMLDNYDSENEEEFSFSRN